MSGTPSLEICQPQEADVIVVRDYRHAKWTTSNQIVYRMSNQLNDQQELIEKYKRRCVDLRKKFEQDVKELREEFEQTIEELEVNLEESHRVINNLKNELNEAKKEDIVYKNEFIDQKQKNALNVMLFHEVTCPYCNKKVFH
ncbi:hypothetical protein ABK040_003701 [Willaertia magna]